MERHYFLLLSPATTTSDAFLQALSPASRGKLLCSCPLGVGGYIALYP